MCGNVANYLNDLVKGLSTMQTQQVVNKAETTE